MNIKPLYDRLLVKINNPEETTEGGIIFDASKEKPQEGTVVSAGNGRLLEDGTVKPLDIKPGDTVLLINMVEWNFLLEMEIIFFSRRRSFRCY